MLIKRGTTADAPIDVQVLSGYHVNSNAPNEEYLIPLALRWEQGPLKPGETVFPKAEEKKYPFAEKPMSVFTDKFRIVAKFRTDAEAPAGPGVLAGKLRYQACSEDRCFPPKTVEIKLPYSIQ